MPHDYMEAPLPLGLKSHVQQSQSKGTQDGFCYSILHLLTSQEEHPDRS